MHVSRKLHTILLSLFTLTISAQDVIIKTDGATIVSKVLEVNPDNIKYKKFSNLEGPTYTILIKDVTAINYESGETDKFDNPSAIATTASQALQQTVSENNAALIAAYNSAKITYDGKKSKKNAPMLYCLLGVTEKSVLEDNMAQISMRTAFRTTTNNLYLTDWINKEKGSLAWISGKDWIGIEVSIKNISTQTIYVDLANTFFVRGNGESMAYYVPTATSTTSTSSSGANINLGAVAGAMGAGDAVGTLAKGVNVSGGKTHGTTKTIYSQRIISIPPNSLRTLDIMPYFVMGDKVNMFETKSADALFGSINIACSASELTLLVGESKQWTETDTPCNFCIQVAYSTTEDCASMYNLHANLYVKEFTGTKSGKYLYSSNMKDFSDNWKNYLYFISKNGNR